MGYLGKDDNVTGINNTAVGTNFRSKHNCKYNTLVGEFFKSKHNWSK